MWFHVVLVLSMVSATLAQTLPSASLLLRSLLNPSPVGYKKSLNYTIGILGNHNAYVVATNTKVDELAICALIAVNTINNSTNILPNANLDPFWKNSASFVANVKNAFELVGNDWSGVTEPTVVSSDAVVTGLGSDATALVSEVLELKKVPGISSTATSGTLGNTGQFPFFNRVIGSDLQQGAAMAVFCHKQGWYKVAVLSTTDSYSSHMTTEFVKMGKLLQPRIEVVAATSFISVANENVISTRLETQARVLLSSRTTVIFAPIVGVDMRHALSELASVGLSDAPYIWIGPDGWGNLDVAPPGAMMTGLYTPPVAGRPAAEVFETAWNEATLAATGSTSPYSTQCMYQYDSVWLLAHALELLEETVSYCAHGTTTNLVVTTESCLEYNTSGRGGVLNQLLRQVSFAGASGWVTLDVAGERRSLWGIWNKDLTNLTHLIGHVNLSTVQYVESKAQIFYSGIGFSSTPPRSYPVFVSRTETINEAFFVFATVVASFLCLTCIVVIICAAYFGDRPIMRLSSHRINIVSTLGVLLCVVGMVLYGVDERLASAAQLNGLCMARVWVFDLGFNIFFLPMFSKVYRINKIYNQKGSTIVVLTDMELLSPVVLFCVVDLFVLIIWTVVDPLQRTLVSKQPVYELTAMKVTTTSVGSCTSRSAEIFFWGLVFVKAIPAVYGALLSYQTRKAFRDVKAMRDSIQIGTTVMLVVLIAGFQVAISFVISDPTARYAMLFAGMVIISLSTLGLVWGGKFHAIWTGQEDQWTLHSSASSKAGEPWTGTSDTSVMSS